MCMLVEKVWRYIQYYNNLDKKSEARHHIYAQKQLWAQIIYIFCVIGSIQKILNQNDILGPLHPQKQSTQIVYNIIIKITSKLARANSAGTQFLLSIFKIFIQNNRCKQFVQTYNYNSFVLKLQTHVWCFYMTLERNEPYLQKYVFWVFTESN